MYSISAIFFANALVTVDASLYDFTTIGECILGYNPWFDLLGHGCYCGFGNYGNVTPEDKYDKCCLEHDECYGNLTDPKEGPQNCSSTLAQYLIPYFFVCEPLKNVYCYLDPPFSWIRSWESCGLGLCDCDRRMVLCWQNARKNKSDTTEGPDKRYCNRSKLPLPHNDDPSWLDYLQITVLFYRNKNRLEYLKEVEEKRRMKEDMLRTNEIIEGMKGNRVYPVITREPDGNHILLPQHPNQWPKPPQKLHQLPKPEQWKHVPQPSYHHHHGSPPVYDDFSNF